MKILTNIQIKELDQYTINEESIRSIDLMERAAYTLTQAIERLFQEKHCIKIFAGPGNNGGDSLAIARLLLERDYHVEVYLFNTTGSLSEDCVINKSRLLECIDPIYFTEITSQFTPPTLRKDDLVIDGLFGSGLNKPLNGGFAAVVKYINSSSATVISIDMPSGLMCEDNTYNIRNHIIRADITLTLQMPKLSFFFPENQEYIGEWMCLDIQLSEKAIEETDTSYFITQKEDIQPILRNRKEFSHKGTFGHGLLIAGSYGMAGASILAARACLRSGIGLLTIHAPLRNNVILQTSVPEAIIEHDEHEMFFSTAADTFNYQAIAIGPGLRQEEETALALLEQIKITTRPMILDADALNIMATHKNWLSLLPKDTILTPHPKELERLVGRCTNSYDLLMKAREVSTKYHIYIILKGAWTAVISPDGNCRFNPTGNPGMATAGSGDVLTGILLALLAQGYPTKETCLLGVYLHGAAGDLAAESKGENGMIAGDIIDNLPLAWSKLEKNEYLCNLKEHRCF